jgi:hypothetical protein
MFKSILAWFEKYEFIAIWLEGIALVAIFILDWKERRDQHREHNQQHRETLEQLRVSQNQVEASQRQVEASHEQVEAGQKPFLTFTATPRASEAAVLSAGGIVGGMVMRCPEDNAELGNDGSGPAINIQYSAIPTIPTSSIARPSGYLVAIFPGQKFLTPITRGLLQSREWEITLTYESLSGRRYRTKIIANDLVLTNIKFEPLANAE